MNNFSFHPACLLFPELGKNELQTLAEDISIRGLLHSVVRHKKQILDGRNRLKACKISKVKPTFIEWNGKGSPTEWIISENLIRRHLSASQKAIIAHDLLPLLEQEAKNRQRLSPGRGKKVAQYKANLSEKGKSSTVAARLAHTSTTYVESVKFIHKQAPELIEKIRSGIFQVPEAMKLSKLPASERKKVLRLCDGELVKAQELNDLMKQVKGETRARAAKAYAKTGKATSDEGILIGDMDLLTKKLSNNSVDLFLTDPPYTEIDLYERLSELAAAKLKPGGLCLAYSGQLYLPPIMEAMGKHLTYWWTFAIAFSGQHCAIHSRRIQNKWKPILAFAKPPLKHAPNWLTDLLHGGGRDKEHHDWGQHESEVEYLIELLTEPGQFVVDPFCGGGLVPAVCKAMGRRWLATEINKTTALIARKRLGEKRIA